MRCQNCPAHKLEQCRGEGVPRFCQLVDPTHPDHDPAYVRILVQDDHIGPFEIESTEHAPFRSCCGGIVIPGPDD
jgi:hypothetical protein